MEGRKRVPIFGKSGGREKQLNYSTVAPHKGRRRGGRWKLVTRLALLLLHPRCNGTKGQCQRGMEAVSGERGGGGGGSNLEPPLFPSPMILKAL